MPRGSRPGERRGGRKKGTPNKATADVKEAAQAFTEDAIKTLAEIMRSSEHPAAARVSAANALLDRGHGKPKQAVEAEVNGRFDHSNMTADEIDARLTELLAEHGLEFASDDGADGDVEPSGGEGEED
jgi:hypothetical protein